ncbi:hypothetical protein O0I10_011565 [Lichtheimia ornata]|uniref:Yeast cell wall synthesis Kre9/Knh1-like N-terminal domain-containing protein n=1 Tax=Lichtheimia ornata TaxID=688661 RepID=A0AAD7XSH9_9FUNG|nr:uncharacterized protein O0I10_011565 [Lichtheimia ornata]KAJ8652760.1 hypothetical protein O0I10_011565 [Lichtheimia ornata]
MKSILLCTAALLSAVSAKITIVTPWAETTWTAGGHGNITWTSEKSDASQECQIQLMNGNASNANMVAFITSPASPVKCSDNRFDIYPLNDFESGKYWVRIGQRESDTWAYSGVFNFKGNGSATPLHQASTFDNKVSGSSSVASSTGAAAKSSQASSSASASASAGSQANQDIDTNAAATTTHTQWAVVAGSAVAAAVALTV